MGLKYHRPKAQAPLEMMLLDFLYGEWGDLMCLSLAMAQAEIRTTHLWGACSRNRVFSIKMEAQ